MCVSGSTGDAMLIEQLSSKNINELVAFKAVVTKRAEVMNRVKMAMYKCELCDAELRLPVGKNFTPQKVRGVQEIRPQADGR